MHKFWIIGLVLALLEGNFPKLIGLKSQRRTFCDESDNETDINRRRPGSWDCVRDTGDKLWDLWTRLSSIWLMSFAAFHFTTQSLKLKRRKTHSHGNKDTTDRLIVIYQRQLHCRRFPFRISSTSPFVSLKLRNYVDAAMTQRRSTLAQGGSFIEVNSCGKFKECFSLA